MLRSAKFLFAFVILLLIAPVQAQSQTMHPPQLLYKKDGIPYLADATTGISTPVLGVEADEYSGWVWSPNGQYLAATLYEKESRIASLRIYDVDQQQYLDTIPKIDANLGGNTFGNLAWSPDSTKLSYAENIEFGTGQLWLLDLATGKQTSLYQTLPNGTSTYSTGVGYQWWSPSGDRLLFTEFYELAGGANQYLLMTDFSGHKPLSLYGRYDASYDPIWSPDGQWVLLRLKDDYYDGPGVPVDDQGDVYLYSMVNGRSYQITHSPSILEQNLHWSADGKNLQYESEGKLVMIPLTDIVDQPYLPVPMQIEPIPPNPVLNLPPSTFKYLLQYPSPDGTMIAYLNQDGDQYSVEVVDSNFQHSRKITDVVYTWDVIGWRP